MKYTQGVFKILKKTEIAENIFDMTIECKDIALMAKAGQFLHIKADGFTLRRPISICEIDKDKGTLRIVFEVRGEGTSQISKLKDGDNIDIIGPLGNGFPLKENTKKALFVGGGIGVPPLVTPAKHYGKNAFVVTGFRNEKTVILENDFKNNGANVFVTTDDGSYGDKGIVTPKVKEIIENNEIDVIYCCGPMVMMKSVSELAVKNNIECFVSLEERMACGIGSCLGCSCSVKREGEEYFAHVCKDGPVFLNVEVFHCD